MAAPHAVVRQIHRGPSAFQALALPSTSIHDGVWLVAAHDIWHGATTGMLRPVSDLAYVLDDVAAHAALMMRLLFQGYCSGSTCRRFPVVLGESGSWLSNPSIAPYCPAYDNGDLALCISNELKARAFDCVPCEARP